MTSQEPMTIKPMELKVIVNEGEDGLLVAQMLDLDLVVTGRSTTDLIDEFEHAIVMEYQIAIAHNCTPFLNLEQAPKEEMDKWDPARSPDTMGALELPEPVEIALAAYLRAGSPSFSITSEDFRIAA